MFNIVLAQSRNTDKFSPDENYLWEEKLPHLVQTAKYANIFYKIEGGMIHNAHSHKDYEPHWKCSCGAKALNHYEMENHSKNNQIWRDNHYNDHF